MIKFSQYDCGSGLGSVLNNIDFDELILRFREAASASCGRTSYQPVYKDYADNLSAPVQGTTSTSYYLVWP